MTENKDLSPELQIAFADAAVRIALEAEDRAATDPTSTRGDRELIKLKVRAAKERRSLLGNELGEQPRRGPGLTR